MHQARQLMEKAEGGCLISNSLAVRPVLKCAIEIGLDGQLETDQFPGNVSAEYAREWR